MNHWQDNFGFLLGQELEARLGTLELRKLFGVASVGKCTESKRKRGNLLSHTEVLL